MWPFFVLLGCIGLILFSWFMNYHGKRFRMHWRYNPDEFQTLPQVTAALQKAGLESCNVIIGIDFTRSNESQGKHTWNNQSLHSLCPPNGPLVLNPYQQVLRVCAMTLNELDDDRWIPTFGFGDVVTKDKDCFSFTPDDPRGCYGFEGVLQRYNEIVPTIQLCGPTNFAPIINRAISIVEQTNEFHVLFILCDGQVTQTKETEQAIVQASKYPLAIVIIGIGDGDHNAPRNYEWAEMTYYDDGLPERAWDNVQFVPFNRLVGPPLLYGNRFSREQEIAFAVAAMQELPAQFTTLKEMGLIE